jgi:hypothetical protein
MPLEEPEVFETSLSAQMEELWGPIRPLEHLEPS